MFAWRDGQALHGQLPEPAAWPLAPKPPCAVEPMPASPPPREPTEVVEDVLKPEPPPTKWLWPVPPPPWRFFSSSSSSAGCLQPARISAELIRTNEMDFDILVPAFTAAEPFCSSFPMTPRTFRRRA